MDAVLQLLDGPLTVLDDGLQGGDEVVAVRQLGGVGLLQDVLAALAALQMLLVLLVVLRQVLRTWQAKNSVTSLAKNSVTSLASCCSPSGPAHMAGKKQRYKIKPSFLLFSVRSCAHGRQKTALQA